MRFAKRRVVTATPCFGEAFRQFAEGGWQGVQHPLDYEGQGLPKLIATPCVEMLNASNLSFALCPLLTDGAIEALLTAGTEAQKQTYVPKLISGEWTGTMNLTEPQAGSDLALVRTRAEPQGDGSFRIFGTKIFITWGEHDMAKNIVHLVLARTPNAPDGVKGISLFVVPKFLVAEDGSLGGGSLSGGWFPRTGTSTVGAAPTMNAYPTPSTASDPADVLIVGAASLPP